LNAGAVVFEGHFDKLLAHTPDQPAPQQPAIVISYVGPGFNAARLLVSPKSPSITAPSTFTFTATAFDASNGVIANVPVTWTSSDLSIGTISNQGVLTPTGKAGRVTITARTPTNLSDSTTATIVTPVIALSSANVSFAATVGGASPPSQIVQITNSGAGTLSGLSVGTIAYGGGASGWLSAALSSATASPSATLTMQATTGTLAAGSYTASVPVLSGVASNSPRTIAVTLTVSAVPPSIVLSSTSLSFSGLQNGVDPAAQSITISNGGGGTLSGLTVASIKYGSGASGWIQDSLSSTIAPATLGVSAVASLLAPGNYAATVSLAASAANNSPRNINVTLTVAAPSCASASQLRSLNSDSTSTMLFINQSPEAVSVYWIDFNGTRVLYNTLPPATQYQQPTYLTHPWIMIGASGKCYGVWLPPATAIAQ
jgi:hypothetical protein